MSLKSLQGMEPGDTGRLYFCSNRKAFTGRDTAKEDFGDNYNKEMILM